MIRLARDFAALCARMMVVFAVLALLVAVCKYSAESYAADVPVYGRTV
ncbi:hypothetical protein [Pandoraea sputorum]|uniref:Uncharacterized protein n=1 Tax=Pandoraea sputorum TaxID=93222 RepID=A0A5E5BIT8_9BURK|nr:hypothetical protein [Pandoraea sputorum]VVE84955.1 hypothetical protein PSP31121_05012 [Pandoraea sputorum]